MLVPLEKECCISFLKYWCFAIFRNRPKIYFVVFCYMCVKMSKKHFFLISVPSKVIQNIMIQAGLENMKDIDNCVIVPAKSILEPFSKNKIPCWVQLCLPTSDSKCPYKNIRLALAIGLPGMNEMEVIASDILCHNIRTSLLNQGLMKSCKRLRITFRILKESPFFAEQLELSLIKMSAEKQKLALPFQSQVDALFENPRYVQAGDILCASSLGDKAAVCLVIRVQGMAIAPGFLVDAKQTKIEQGPEMKSYIPTHPTNFRSSSCSTITSANYKEFIIDACPPWLDNHGACLAKFLLPFLLKIDGYTVIEPTVRHLPVILLSGPRGSGKRAVVERASEGAGVWDFGGLHVHHNECSVLRGTGPGSVEKSLSSMLEAVSSLSPCIIVVHNVEWLSFGRDGPDEGRGIESWLKWLDDIKELRKGVIAVVATTRLEKFQLPGPLARMFVGEISLHEPPNLFGRESILRWIMCTMGVAHCNELPKELARHTAGFLYGDLTALVSGTLRKKYFQVRNGCHENEEITLGIQDFEDTLGYMHAAYSDAIGAPKIPSVAWKDVGGLSEIREEILTTIEFPIKYPELTKSGLKRTGILLYGPPGTGKTLLAKAVATECSFNFISVKGPELLNMYVGQSEANVREVFQRARSATPCIIFFDELDSLAPNRGRTGDSGGVMDRVVSQLLAEMDGQQKIENVFVMGATNRPDLVDPALLRPGRFDKLLYVGPYEDKASQLSVMSALTRKFKFACDVNLEELVSLLPERLSGADMQAICSGAMLNAIEREVSKAELVKRGELTGSSLQVYMEDFMKTLACVKPSISEKDLQNFQRLRLQFEKSVNI